MQDLEKHPGWFQVEVTPPGRRLSDLPLSQGTSARISLLSGGMENSTLSLQALWRSHLSGWNCSSHTLWIRAWSPKSDMWSALCLGQWSCKLSWKELWWVFLCISVQLGLGFGMFSHGLNCGSHALQGVGFGCNQGTYTCLRGLMLLLFAAPWIMEFYWCGSEACGGCPVLLSFSSIHSSTCVFIHPFIQQSCNNGLVCGGP